MAQIHILFPYFLQKSTSDQKLLLPSTVFASAVETNVGLLNKAAPHSGE